jgi:hypothetical protein
MCGKNTIWLHATADYKAVWKGFSQTSSKTAYKDLFLASFYKLKKILAYSKSKNNFRKPTA